MRARGYTMLEVLITSIVMVLLVLAAYPTLNTATRRQELVTNSSILETCVTQGIATAKAPTVLDTTTVHITFTAAPVGCQVDEVNGAGAKTLVNSFTIANPSTYTLVLSPTVPNNEYVISVRPPYSFTVPSGSQLLMVSLHTVATPVSVSSIFFNLVTGTVQLRST